MSSKTPAAPSPPAMTLPTTSFDFLSGGYSQAARTRLVSLLMVGAVIAIALVVTGRGVSTMFKVRSVNAQIVTAQAQQAADTHQLASVASVSGVGEPTLQADLAARKAQADLAVSGEPAAAEVLTNLQQAANSVGGATIDSVDFSTTGQAGTASAGAAQAAPTDAQKLANAGTALSGGAGSPTTTAPSAVTTLTITLTVNSYSDVQAWTSALKADMPYLSDPVGGTIVAGGSTSVSVTTVGTLSPSVVEAHQNLIDQKLKTPGAIPTTTGGK